MFLQLQTLRRHSMSAVAAQTTCLPSQGEHDATTAAVSNSNRRCGVMIEPTLLGLGEGFNWLEEVQTV